MRQERKGVRWGTIGDREERKERGRSEIEKAMKMQAGLQCLH